MDEVSSAPFLQVSANLGPGPGWMSVLCPTPNWARVNCVRESNNWDPGGDSGFAPHCPPPPSLSSSETSSGSCPPAFYPQESWTGALFRIWLQVLSPESYSQWAHSPRHTSISTSSHTRLSPKAVDLTVLVKVQKPSTEIYRVGILGDFWGTSMFKHAGEGKNRLSWEIGEGLIEHVRFHECPNLFPPPSPFTLPETMLPHLRRPWDSRKLLPSSFANSEEPTLHAGKIQAEPNQVFIWFHFVGLFLKI